MNGPATIYRLKPLFETPRNLDLPTNMYKMKNPLACVTNTSDHTEEEKEILTGIMDQKPLPELVSLEARWDSVLRQLSELKLQIESVKKSVADTCKLSGYSMLDNEMLNNLKVFQKAVISASPTSPPFSLLLLKHLCRSSLPISISSHVHSSVSNLPDNVKCFNEQTLESDYALNLVLIWKDDMTDTELSISPTKQIPIKGEVNILRLLGRLGLKLLKYPSDELVDTIQTDSILDLCHRLLHVKTAKEKASLFKNLNAKLGRSSYFGGDEINISDISAWSALKQINVNPAQDLSQSMAKWYERIDEILFL